MSYEEEEDTCVGEIDSDECIRRRMHACSHREIDRDECKVNFLGKKASCRASTRADTYTASIRHHRQACVCAGVCVYVRHQHDQRRARRLQLWGT